MRKTIYLFITLVTYTSSVLAQDEDLHIPKDKNSLAEYTEVIMVDSTPQNQLYANALEWISKTYKSAKSVIQTSDKEGGMIIGKGIGQTLVYNNSGFKKDGGYFSYNISIYCKDDKFKYLINDIKYNKGEMALIPGADLAEEFPHNWTGFMGKNKQTRREWKSFQRQANLEIINIIENLKQNMKNSKTKNEW